MTGRMLEINGQVRYIFIKFSHLSKLSGPLYGPTVPHIEYITRYSL